MRNKELSPVQESAVWTLINSELQRATEEIKKLESKLLDARVRLAQAQAAGAAMSRDRRAKKP